MDARLFYPVVPAALAVACSTAAPSRDPVPPFRHDAFYASLEQDAEAFTVVNGEWVESLGDAPFYGLAFYTYASLASPAPPQAAAWSARSDAARAYALAQITNADFFNGDFQQMVMSTFGLIDRADATGDTSDVPTIDAFMDRLDKLVALIGWYVDIGSQRSWAIGTYGPTAISALLGLLNAEYAHLLGGTDVAAARVDWAKQMAQHIDDAAWNGSYYAIGGGTDGLDLYPNVAMMALDARLFQLTGDEAYRTRATALYDAIQPLKLTTSPTRYYSPYSADTMGAKTHDYSTLSSHNYLALGLLLLYEITGKAAYVEEMDSIEDALATELVGTWCLSDVHHEACSPGCTQPPVCVVSTCSADACNEGLLHHWIDGRLALPTDPTFFCSGCNLQALYVLWYRQARLK